MSGRPARPVASGAAPGGMIPAYLYLLRAKDLMDRAYAEPLDVPALARAACASPAHFSRVFKRAFGETPHQYLVRRRIERAKDLLRGTDQPVTDVCLAVGFQSLGSFSSAFRAIVGEPPSEYRQRWAGAARRAEAAVIPACFSLMWTRPVGRAVFEKQGAASGATLEFAPSAAPADGAAGAHRRSGEADGP